MKAILSLFQTSTVRRCLKVCNYSATRKFSVASSHDEVIIDILAGKQEGIAVIGLNRPASKNAIGRNLANQLHEAVEKLKYKNNMRVLIVRLG